jgi:lactate dehydrogenase-like 2-hydroxyacid dehydrogenase
MKTLFLTPNFNGIFSLEQQSEIVQQGGQVYKDPILFDKIPELSGSEDIVLALDPDFCNWEVSADDISKWAAVRAICLQTTGFGWIDIEACAKRGIFVTNNRGFSTNAAAEFYQFITLGVIRRVALLAQDGYKQDFVKHQWNEIAGKKVGIIGLGSIGKRYAELLAGNGAHIQYWSKSSRDDRYKFVSLKELYATSDIIFIAVSVYAEQAELFTPELLNSMRSSTIVVRVSHSITAHIRLIEMVQSGEIAGYGFEEDNAVLGSIPGNVFGISKIGWATVECMQKNGVVWLQSIKQAHEGVYPNRLN